jgi:hypothetical protein
MKKVLLAATAMALALTVPAKADLVLSDLIFRDLGATGFGNAPRLLTLQNNPLESGGTIATAGGGTAFFAGDAGTVVPFTPCTSNGSCGIAGGGTRTGANESLVYSVGALGWNSGAEVGIGLDEPDADALQLCWSCARIVQRQQSGGHQRGAAARPTGQRQQRV